MVYEVEFTMTIRVNADSPQDADDRAWDYVNTGVLDVTDLSTYVREVSE